MPTKLANPLLQPPLPPPAVPSTPKPPALLTPPKPAGQPKPPTSPGPLGQAKGFFDGMSSLLPSVSDAKAWVQKTRDNLKYDTTAGLTATTPPLSLATSSLPDSIRGPVNTGLGYLQKGVQYAGPQGFAGVLGGVAPGLTKGVLSTGVGLPALAGLHGLLSGGESFAAAKTLFDPLLGKLGLGG